jgi:hypothetical protein
MKFAVQTLAVIAVFCGLVAQGFALDREAFTFTNYDLDVRVEPGLQRLSVRGKITLRNDSSTPQKNVSLQISSSLGWRSVKFEGGPMQFVSQTFTSDIDHTGALSEAIVTLPRGVPPKSSIELEVGYEGLIVLDATRLTRIGVPEEKAKHSDWDQISQSFTAVRGAGYVAWYPMAMESANLSEGNSVFETLGRWRAREAGANMNIRFGPPGSEENEPTLPKLCNVKAVNGGAPVGGPKSSAAECSYAPLCLTAPAFAMGNYDASDHQGITIYSLSEHKRGAENYALASNLALPLVSEWFGAPKEKAQVVDLADPEATAYESGTMLFTPLKSTDSRMYQVSAIHLMTHAAFPSLRPWIYEGLAHFAQALYRERLDGRKAALKFMDLHRFALADAEKAAVSRPAATRGADESLLTTSVEEFYRSKAMYVWWMLRDMVGEEPLKKALAAYQPEQDKDPSYLQHLIETRSKKDLQWFFDDWVYHDRGLPDFKVESAYTRPVANGPQIVTISVENLGTAAAEVPITLRMQEGEVTKRLEVRAKSRAAIRLEAISKPEEVIVNDGSVPETDTRNNTFIIGVSGK